MVLGTKTLILISVGAVVAILVAFVVCLFLLRGVNQGLKKAQVKIGGATFDIEVARTAIEKAKGLSGREVLGENEGMLFVFDEVGVQAFWMRGMKFPLDFIWLRDGKVVGFSKDIPNPQSQAGLSGIKAVPSPDLIDMVIEVNSGTIDKLELDIGDAVEIIFNK